MSRSGRQRTAESRSPAVCFWTVLLILLAPGLHCTAHAQHPSASEHAIKAAFIYNFTKFVSWPATSFSAPSVPFKICVADDAGISAILRDTIRGKQVAGRAVAVVSVRDAMEASACQILFITHLNNDERNRLLAAVKGKPVLTIGEERGFSGRGGIINFFTANDRVQFEINVNAARQSELEISSRLLSLARIVKGVQP